MSDTPSQKTESSAIVDVAIIGAGPTGLFAAFYAGLRGMTIKLIDSLEIPGGQLTTLYPEKYIYDAPGFPRILARDLARALLEQAMQYQPVLCLGEQVKRLDPTEDQDGYTVHTDRAAHRARAVIISAGVGAMSARTLPLDGAAALEGNGLHYFVKSAEAFRDKRVLIVGGGDSAVDWANMLAGTAAELSLIHRRDQFRAHEDSVAKMKQSPTRILTFHELHALDGPDRVRRATLINNQTNEKHTLDIDAVLVNIGFHNSLGPIQQWGLKLRGSQIEVDPTMRASLPRIFAAGDICTYPGKLKLIATGFAEACIAANQVKNALDPAARVFPGHSSSLPR